MNFQIAALLTQDGLTNGAIYALLALAMVLVFTVTRVVFVPQGEFVAFGTLSLAALQNGLAPKTIWLLVGMAVVATVLELIALARRGAPPRRYAIALACWKRSEATARTGWPRTISPTSYTSLLISPATR